MNIINLLTALVLLLPISASAFDKNAEFITLKPVPPNTIITKGDVVVEIKRLYQGRILSVSKDKAHGDNCHVIKLLTDKGEFKTINVSCTD